jgi:Protein of unknown function (DUF3187)
MLCQKKTLSLILLATFMATTSFAGSFEGPLVVKNGHPLYVPLGTPSLASAEPVNALDLNFSYSSTYLVDGYREWHFGIDLETAQFDIQLKHLVGESTEIGFDLPVIRYGSGFMDDFLDAYHRVLGMNGTYGRSNRPKNVFLFDVTRDGKTVMHEEPNKTGVGDVMLEIKRALYRMNESIVSIQGFLNIPTGDPGYGFGSGETNGGIALLLNEPLRKDVMLYVNAGMGLIKGLHGEDEVNLKNYYFGGAGLEWMLSHQVLLNAQMMVETSPFPKTGVRSMDDPSMIASIGGRYRIHGPASVGIAITEDPDTSGAPDFMAGVDYRYRF